MREGMKEGTQRDWMSEWEKKEGGQAGTQGMEGGLSHFAYVTPIQ